ncbi:GlxA family transcriptional regulator [Enterovirga rhinocerotis]|uniref:AraC family transcriptional regulator with amidase-like domain n=1 Tax=Enterovirga rhinocerotis TaxID=1339210 RepID=A0A4R7BJC4_9HYPH|nr:GlxA family transcriptional regulator [Enterovirga rhinocerotis]TDR85358.1 AraC family transcriptional regulator with amidase-like domain [Enterovirga rhinocerotis]
MSLPLTVALLIFPRCQVLDVTGPAMVFEAGNDEVGRAHYDIRILSAQGGVVRTSSAVALVTEPVSELPPTSIDTLLVAGGDESGLKGLVGDETVRRWSVEASHTARRYGSVCSGAYALAHFGLLDGKRVATHWSTCASLAEAWPDVEVDRNALFVNDGSLWTSAGVTTGIDMSLEMVAADLGNAVAHAIAKRLVLYARRPGYQSQFSPVLDAQSQADARFAPLVQWMRENLAQQLDVPCLADRARMSERTFLRRFTQSTGETPAHFVETLRLDRTRTLLATGMLLKDIAAQTGYSSAAQLSKAFERRFGMTPTLFRELHCTSHSG